MKQRVTVIEPCYTIQNAEPDGRGQPLQLIYILEDCAKNSRKHLQPASVLGVVYTD